MSELKSVDLTEHEAIKLTAKIREKVTEIWPLIVEAFERRAWIALGLPSWDAYCDSHLRGMTPSIDREERQRQVLEMREAGMSTRAIGSALNVTPMTVSRDLSGVSNVTPETTPKIIGTDGKEYSPTRPSPPPPTVEPFRAPKPEDLPDWVDPVAAERYAEATARQKDTSYIYEFVKALHKDGEFLKFDVERIARIADDDVMISLMAHADTVQDFCQSVKRARSGLRLVSGGRS